MVPKRWVVKASPLILLGKTNHLGLLGALADQITVPRAVVEEVGAKPDGAAVLWIITEDPVVAVVDDQAALPEILSWDLGAGETQIIVHAPHHGPDRARVGWGEGQTPTALA